MRKSARKRPSKNPIPLDGAAVTEEDIRRNEQGDAEKERWRERKQRSKEKERRAAAARRLSMRAAGNTDGREMDESFSRRVGNAANSLRPA